MQNAGSRRISTRINRRPAVNIHHARRCATVWGFPLNTHVSLNLSQCGFSERDAVRMFRKLISERFSPWLRRNAANDNGLTPTYVWTVEAPHGKVGSHWLLHLPGHLVPAFSRKVLSWLEGLGATVTSTAVKITKVDNPIGMGRYILKGIDPVWAKHLAVHPVPQGQVIGKRSGFSRNLGPAARKRRGDKVQRHRF